MFGVNIKAVLKSKIRHRLSFLAHIHQDQIHRKAIQSLVVVFDVYQRMTVFKRHHQIILNVQKRVRNFNFYKDSKVEGLRIYWERSVARVLKMAGEKED